MQELGGTAKAMVITVSRESAVKYRQAFEDYINKKGYNIHASEDKVEKLSQIIAEINSIAGKSYDNDVAVKAMLQIKDIMMKSDKLKTSAKSNTEKDFEYTYYDNIDDALIEGLEQNQDFFSLLLGNNDMNKKVLGIFADEIYNSLKEAI